MFILRAFLGIPHRYRSKWPPFLIGFGIFACIASALLAVVVAPTNFANGWRAASDPHPTPAELRAMPAGRRVLVEGQLSSMPIGAEATKGLALFYIERSESATGSAKREREPVTGRQREWDVASPISMTLSDGSAVSVRVPAQTSLSNAQTIRLPDDMESVAGLRIERSYVGYFPGQHLIVQGIWEDAGLTADEFFAGSLEDYLYELRVARPLRVLLTSLCCGGVGGVMVVVGFVVRRVRG